MELSQDTYLTRGATHSLELHAHQTKGMGTRRQHVYKLRQACGELVQTADSLTAQLSARRDKIVSFSLGLSDEVCRV